MSIFYYDDLLAYADDYGRAMYIEVCEEYVKDLNRELISAKEIICKEIG